VIPHYHSVDCRFLIIIQATHWWNAVPNDISTFWDDSFFICVKLDAIICGCNFLFNLCMCVLSCVWFMYVLLYVLPLSQGRMALPTDLRLI